MGSETGGSPTMKPFIVRLPEELHHWAVKRAKRERRSLNNFIMVVLERLRASEDEGERRGR